MNEDKILLDYLRITKLDNDNYIAQNLVTNAFVKIDSNTLKLITILNKHTLIDNAYKSVIAEGFDIEIEELKKLKEEFENNGLLANNESKAFSKQNYLKLSVTILPEKIINQISRKLIFLFEPVISICLLMLCIIFSTYSIFENIHLVSKIFSLNQLLEFSIYFILIYLLIDFIHEFGHTTALNYFNEKSGKMGLGFYLFVPVLFVNVSNAWNLSKKKRLIVNAGGLYFELLFINLLFLIYFFNNRFELLFISFIILVQMLFQFNPFIRTDGYWILSDFLDIPNLKQKSLIELKKIFLIYKNPKIQINKPLFIYGLIGFLLSYLVIFGAFITDTSVIYIFGNASKLFFDYKNSSFNFFNVLLFLASILFYILLIKEGLMLLKGIKNFKKEFFLATLLLISFDGFSQCQLIGKVVDINKHPIPYTNIWSKSNQIGVVSNENGEFSININPESANDTIYLSHIGFKKAILKIINCNKTEFTLEDDVIELSEVAILSIKGIDIINKVKEKIPSNYPVSTTVNNIYFNYEVKNDSDFLAYFDGELNLNIPNYNKNNSLDARLINLKLNVNNFDKIKNFYSPSPKSIISSIFPLNLPFIKNEKDYTFEVNKFTSDKVTYYNVSFSPKDSQKKWQYQGSFIVDSKTFAITESNFNLVKNVQNKDASISIGFSNSKTVTSSNSEEYVVKYKLVDNLYYNNFLKYATNVSFYDSKIEKTQNIFIQSVLLTNLFISNPKSEELKAGKNFNLYNLKTQKGENKKNKNTYLNIDWDKKIKKLKEENPELND